ncbi:hypothetical protein HMPREF0454_02010 [Hafnia alvei ATCC 51873]|uniref:Uncharacterized protein n=1 Tax=Hafnia alvei ATCC 51873 TaxID=1002364 RepID=G9Y5Z4_HAFAL|nr:hypothetical protein HMPREF0454_02010 [Hafnia alvei ATCC 51873]
MGFSLVNGENGAAPPELISQCKPAQLLPEERQKSNNVAVTAAIREAVDHLLID